MNNSTFHSVSFSITPSNEQSNIEIKVRDILKNNKINPIGVYSTYMGTTDNNYKCETCFNPKKTCVGHEGTLKLFYPVCIPTSIMDYKKWVKIICHRCGNILLPDAVVQKIPIHERIDKILKVVKSKSVHIKTCAHCGLDYPKIENDKDSPNLFRVVTGSGSKEYYTLLPHLLKEIFERVTDETVKMMGKPLSSAPRNFIRTDLIITPPQTRPEVTKMGSNTKSTVDEHTLLYQILIEKKNDLFIANPTNISEQMKEDILEYNNIYYNLIKGKDNSSITARMMGKPGLFRQNMMGKRVKKASRGVIAQSIKVKIDELGMPLSFAKIIQMRDIVQEYNKDILAKYVRNGLSEYPGSTSIIRNGKNYSISDNFIVEIGDMVFHDMIDGDPTAFCRQPSLMISNIAAHKIKVLMNPNHRTFMINGIVCPLGGGDFDGNMHSTKFWSNAL